jgi:hypothetical protein
MANIRRGLVNGGIAGPVLALFLKRAGIEPLIFEVEAYPRTDDAGGGFQIMGCSLFSEIVTLAGVLLRGHHVATGHIPMSLSIAFVAPSSSMGRMFVPRHVVPRGPPPAGGRTRTSRPTGPRGIRPT